MTQRTDTYDTELKPVAQVRVTHEGYGMVLHTYVAYALPEGIHDLYAAPPVAAPVDVTESADALPSGVQMIALRRFAECCEDSDAGGHDVRKEMVKSLCELGALRSIGFGRHETTKYGDWLLERDTALAQRGEKK